MRTKARAPSSSPASTLRLLPCRRPHEYVRAEPWGCAGGQPLAEEGDVEGRAVLRLNHFKAGGCEQRMHLCRRGQVVGRRRLRPRHRIGWSVVGAFHHIVDAEQRAGLRHARRLPVEPRAILDVHRNVRRHGGIEGGVGKRQVDVQHELAGLQMELLDSVFGRVAPTAVELVDRGEVRRCQPFDIESGCRQGLEKRRSEVGHAIVACDRALELFHGRHPQHVVPATIVPPGMRAHPAQAIGRRRRSDGRWEEDAQQAHAGAPGRGSYACVHAVILGLAAREIRRHHHAAVLGGHQHAPYRSGMRGRAQHVGDRRAWKHLDLLNRGTIEA